MAEYSSGCLGWSSAFHQALGFLKARRLIPFLSLQGGGKGSGAGKGSGGAKGGSGGVKKSSKV